jgi:KDO2-lipid IV(A) lauroyltransferase
MPASDVPRRRRRFALATHAGLLFLRLVAALPRRLGLLVGAGLGAVYGRVSARRRRIVNDNLRLCFPEIPESTRRRLARAHFRALGMGLVEAAWCWWRPDGKLPPFTVEGLEHLEAALARGRGAVLFTGHFTTLDLGGRLLASRTPIVVLYRPADNPVFNAAMVRGRAAHAARVVARDDVRGLLRALRANLPVWYAPDQGRTGANSALVPFFGVPAPTHLALGRLVRASGAPVVPFFPARLPGGRYHLRLAPALEDVPGPDPVAEAARLHALLEEAIRAVPEQYLWTHDRFKRHRRP